MSFSHISEYMSPGRRVHLVGIGGVSMRALGEVLLGMGLIVSGSDLQYSAAIGNMRSLGITIHIGHDPGNISGAEFIIRTAAAKDENPEIAAAREAGIPVFERAQAWGVIMRRHQNAVCVSGTHGKTTTTSMITHILMEAALDPTVMIGGYLPLLNAGHRVGKGETIVMESCEYCNSFLNFAPTVAVILNIEADHLDFFKDLDDISASFRRFAGLVPDAGCIVYNDDDDTARKTVMDLNKPLISFGFSKGADVQARNINDSGHCSFDVYYKDRFYTHLDLNVAGRHNAANALAAAAVSIFMNIPGSTVAKGLSSFYGAGRRLEFKGTYNGAKIYDDYAHHPSEIRALIQAVKSMGFDRILCIFQPHTYTRTKALFDDFVRELSVADFAVLAEIYAARETNTINISSADLARQIPNARYFKTFDEITDFIEGIARPGDVILTVGAGDIYTVGETLSDEEPQKAI